jgi:glyceraldehyde-3-phosphate dehydrogenase/erythrose-4-phosphate dehydrogenase
MTASQRTHATSDNSVPRSSRAGTENVIPQRDPRLRSIAQHINNRNGAVTVAEIATEAGWTRDESGDHISRMQTTNLVQLLDDQHESVLLLTAKGKRFAQGADF